KKKIGEFGNQLSARVAAARYYERQQSAASRGIFRMIGMFAKVDHAIAQNHSIFKGLEIPGIFAGSGNIEVFGAAARRHNQDVVIQRTELQLHATCRDIDRNHFVAAESEPAATANFANGLHDVTRIDIAGGDLRQKRRKQQKILSTNYGN